MMTRPLVIACAILLVTQFSVGRLASAQEPIKGAINYEDGHPASNIALRLIDVKTGKTSNTTVTGSDGDYRFATKPSQTAVVFPDFPPGYMTSPSFATLDPREASAVSDVNFVLKPRDGLIQGYVYDEMGGPVAAARIQIATWDPAAPVNRIVADSTVETPGEYQFWVTEGTWAVQLLDAQTRSGNKALPLRQGYVGVVSVERGARARQDFRLIEKRPEPRIKDADSLGSSALSGAAALSFVALLLAAFAFVMRRTV